RMACAVPDESADHSSESHGAHAPFQYDPGRCGDTGRLYLEHASKIQCEARLSGAEAIYGRDGGARKEPVRDQIRMPVLSHDRVVGWICWSQLEWRGRLA